MQRVRQADDAGTRAPSRGDATGTCPALGADAKGTHSLKSGFLRNPKRTVD
jgi:hypothetical protein